MAALIFLPMQGDDMTGEVKSAIFEEAVVPMEEKPISIPVSSTVVIFASGIIGLMGINRMLRK